MKVNGVLMMSECQRIDFQDDSVFGRVGGTGGEQ